MFPSKSVKKILVHYLHKEANVDKIITPYTKHVVRDIWFSHPTNSLWFDLKSLLTNNIDLLLRQHMVDVVGVLAPRSAPHNFEEQAGVPILQTYNVFNYRKSFVYPRNTVPNFGEIAKYVDNMLCKSFTKYSRIDMFRLKT